MSQQTLDPSPADAAKAIFDSLRSEIESLPRKDSWSEADTRSKLIDPMFLRVLGWSESELQREAPVVEGYVDYVLGVEFRHLHVEAKRAEPRFRLNSPSGARHLKLTGPHLLGNKQMAPHVEQAARYSFELGTDFTLLTNGQAYIVVHTRPAGQSWRDGHALVFHDLNDIAENFAEFHATLARQYVVAGALIEHFTSIQRLDVGLHRPLDLVRNPNADFVRNPFWARISMAVGPLLTDEPDNQELQREIIQNCYVSTAASKSADAMITELLRDKLPSWMTDARVAAVKAGGKMDGFAYALEDDIKNHRGKTYILTGGVGSGKTTFLRRYSSVTNQKFVQQWCIWFHVDFLRIGDVPASERPHIITSYFFKRCRQILQQDYAELVPTDGAELRSLFSTQLQEANKTVLYGIDAGPERQRLENEIVHQLYTSDEAFVGAVLHRQTSGRRVVFVLDNTDQLGAEFQESVFLFAQKICGEFVALTLVALREEKFFAAYRRGVFDAFGDRRFHVGSPPLADVIKSRLYYAVDRYRERALAAGEGQNEVEQATQILRALISSTTGENKQIVEYLACVSNGDMRHALGTFREFISSGNTYVDKIARIIAEHGSYTVPFHEFAKSAILGSKRYYNSQSSHIVNVFLRTSSTFSSHLTTLRILSRLSSAMGASTATGSGLVETSALIREFRQTFGVAEELSVKASELLSRGLLESEPPKQVDFVKTEAIKASAAGYYYYRYLVRAFAYIDLVHLDTPVANEEVARQLAEMAESTDLETRFERVRVFLDYLAEEESRELEALIGRDGPFAQPVVNVVQGDVETEILEIERRSRRYRRY